jgi:hypothetical protein
LHREQGLLKYGPETQFGQALGFFNLAAFGDITNVADNVAVGQGTSLAFNGSPGTVFVPHPYFRRADFAGMSYQPANAGLGYR